MDKKKLYRVSENAISAYEPVVHDHAANYPDINAGNAWNVMADPTKAYNKEGGAKDHYLHKPAGEGARITLNNKLKIKSTNAKQKKEMAENFEKIAKTGKVQ